MSQRNYRELVSSLIILLNETDSVVVATIDHLGENESKQKCHCIATKI